MSSNSASKQLLKILIGAAWLDGKLQTEEQAYLAQVASQKGLADDPELNPWINGLRSVSATECYQWVEEYLGSNPSPEDCQQLLEDISGLIYSDGTVDSEEARLLAQIQQIELDSATPLDLHQALIKKIQTLYKRWASQ